MSAGRETKKIQIRAVIDFCRAKGLPNSNTEIFKFFGVPQPTGSKWFPKTVSVKSDRQPLQAGNENEPPTLKNPDVQLPSLKRQNPVRNGGRDRKRLKSMIEELESELEEDASPPPLSPSGPARSSSSSLPGEPVTPPRCRIAQPTRKGGEQDVHQVEEVFEGEVKIKGEMDDDEIEV